MDNSNFEAGAASPETDLTGDLAPLRDILARSSNESEIMDMSLVLASQSVKHWIEFDGTEFILSLEESEVPIARELVLLYRTENHGYQDSPLPASSLDLYLAPLIFLGIPVLCYFAIETQPWANWWHSHGRADARAILDGEWWRCLTATTLHADNLHFLSNLVSGYFILNLLNHRLGIGTIMILASLGGAGSNFLVAATTGPKHLSIGFSSVVFCALGLLAAVETLYLPHRKEKNLRRLTPLISAFFIAVMVGLGENADVKAHFYGFGIGVILGILTKFLPQSNSRPAVQAGQVLFVFALYTLAWFLATLG